MLMSRPRALLMSLCAAIVGIVLGGPLIAEWVVRGVVLPKVGERLGRKVRVGQVWIRWGNAELRDLEVDGGGGPVPVRVPRIRASFDVGPLFTGRLLVHELVVESPRLVLVRGLPGDDNVSSILERRRQRQTHAS